MERPSRANDCVHAWVTCKLTLKLHLDFVSVTLYAFSMSQQDHRIDEFIHPELHENEIFFANTDWDGFRKMRWQTKRKGVVAYDGKGNKLSHADWFPVFLDPDELEKGRVSLAIARQQWRDHANTQNA